MPRKNHEAVSVAALQDSWELSLRASGKSRDTLKTYTQGLGSFTRWCREHGEPEEVTRTRVQAWLTHLVDTGPHSTALTRLTAVRAFVRWAASEEEVATNFLNDMKSPQPAYKVVQPYTEEELRLFFRACQGRSFLDRRDEALARLISETGVRTGDCLTMTLRDTNLTGGISKIFGKGSKERQVSFGTTTAQALDRYIRLRRSHRLAHTDTLWLGERGQALGPTGLRRSLQRRAELAGLPGRFYPHRLRHTWASRWLDKGGSEQGLMKQAGWSSPRMAQRYSLANMEQRSIAEAKRLGLGDEL